MNEYRTFVLHKAAPAYPITNTVLFNLLHGALGLATEFLELELSTTSENTHEELNDLGWYLQLSAHSINIVPEALPVTAKRETTELTLNVLRRTLEEYVSCVKKVAIYQNIDAELLLVANFQALWKAYLLHLTSCNYTLELAIAENMDKLNKRYKAKFTKEESSLRKDKA